MKIKDLFASEVNSPVLEIIVENIFFERFSLSRRIVSTFNMTKADLLQKFWLNKLLPNLKSFNLVLFAMALLWMWSCSLESVNNRATKVEENAMLAGLAYGKFGKDGEPYYFEHVYASLENLHLKLVNGSSDESDVRRGVQDWLVKSVREDFQDWQVGFQDFRYSQVSNNKNEMRRGRNVFAHWRAPATDGSEVILVTAPIYLQSREYLNEHGIQARALLKNSHNSASEELNNFSMAILMSVMKAISNSSFYSKDILVVFVDEGSVGMQAFIQEYLRLPQRSGRQIKIETVSMTGEMPSGVLQAGLNLELGNHREYVEIGVVAEGLNGQMPNLDLIVAMDRCIFGNFPFRIHDRSRYSPRSLTDMLLLNPKLSLKGNLVDLIDGAKSISHNFGSAVGSVVWPLIKSIDFMSNILWTLKLQIIGLPTHAHSVLLKYKINAVTVTGMPLPLSENGTPAINMWPVAHLVEDTIRTISNLVEHLHANNFFYFMADLDRFVSLTQYFPAIGFLFAIMLFRIFELWDTMPKQSGDVIQEISSMLAIITVSYSYSAVTFVVPYFVEMNSFSQIALVLSFPALLVLTRSKFPLSAYSAQLLNLWNLVSTAALTSSLSIMNFSVTFFFSLWVSLTLIMHQQFVLSRHAFMVLSPILIILIMVYVDRASTFQSLISDWVDAFEWYGVWQYPFICFIWTPFAFLNALIINNVPSPQQAKLKQQ